MIEKIIFNLLAFTLFIFMFFKIVRKNDTSYVYLLVIQFLGIVLSFIELVANIKLGLGLKILMYVLSIVIPIIVFVIEGKMNINFLEIINMFLAEIYLIMGKDLKAEKCLKEAIKKYPNNVKTHKRLAKIYEKNNMQEKAIEEYERILEIDENNDDVAIRLGKLYSMSNRKMEAKQIFNDILLTNPANYKASIELADILFEECEYKDAIQVYTNALKYNPADYDLYYNLGMTYTMLNDFQKAKESYEKAAQINSDTYHAKYTLGQLSLIYGELDEAKKYFEECVNSEDIEAGSYFYLARVAIIKGEQDNAINYANIAIEDDNSFYNKIQNDNIFVTIKDRVNKPVAEENKNIERNLTEKEIKIFNHLSHTCKLVGKLNNNDIQMIENVMKTKEQDKNQELEKE